jgi:ATP phosphoribosyltransferase regulatory subunit
MQQSVPTRWQQVPSGTRDILPADQARRQTAVTALRDEFARWGYREVATPTLEYLDTFVRGAGQGVTDRLFKIVDRGGALLALRPEMTVPIARLAATRMLADATLPLRLSYVAPVFRGQEAGRSRMREFVQVGVELIGVPGMDADAEVIALALAALRRAGAVGTVAHIGHLGLLAEWLDALPEDQRDDVRTRLYRKEFVQIDDGVGDAELSALLRILPDLHGPGALERAERFAISPRSRAALDELAAVFDRVAEYGFADAVEIDFGIIRDFSYYTGIVVEAYGAGTGYPVLGGGRYDTLLGRFGPNSPATGFAIGLDRMVDTIPQTPTSAADLILAGNTTDRARLVALATKLRNDGMRVVMAVGCSWAEGLRLAQHAPAAWLACPDGSGVRLHEVDSGRDVVADADEIGAVIAENQRKMTTWIR